ncbi:hypothetical protein C8Q76DRAFT_605875 [Earliella scabrosa]|nr:hypothetical protein C8Q76DRAFT_605875 [Earliella scabrosa]
MPTENSSNTAQETVSTSQVDKGTRKKKSAKHSHKVALPKSSKAVASGTSVSSLLRIPVPLSTATREQVSQYALLTSITGGTFEDVKFFAFSRRAASGESVGTPRPLFGNSALIRKASSHFDFVLTKGFAESGIVDLDAPFPRNRPSAVEIDEYGYASDSDLEDDSDDNPGGMLEESMSSLSLGGADGPKPEVQAQSANEETTGQAQNEPPTAGGEKVSILAVSRFARPGRIVFLTDIAYRTWQAFLFFVYTGKVSFVPLRSQCQADPISSSAFDPPPCSPKSMYRLADKYDIETLRRKAADDIKSKLTVQNILEELFSSFTLTHPEILKLEVEFLLEHITDPVLASSLPKLLQDLENGELHFGAAAVFSIIVSKLIAGGSTSKKCPKNCQNNSYRCNSCGTNLA